MIAASTTNPDGPIAITTNELRRLFHALVMGSIWRLADVITWSTYRRRHQDQARTSRCGWQAITET